MKALWRVDTSIYNADAECIECGKIDQAKVDDGEVDEKINSEKIDLVNSDID